MVDKFVIDTNVAISANGINTQMTNISNQVAGS